jgi:hypothetical protein
MLLRRNREETSARYVVIPMLRTIWKLKSWPSAVADYTVGTVIVLVLLATAARRSTPATTVQ